jgi:hypothetical protein
MRRRVLILGLLAGSLLANPSSALGECDGPFASFQNAAPSARRIIIGDVVATLPGPPVENDGRTSRFTLQGWSVLDGDEPITIDVRDLLSQPCAGYIMARPGDRIAIAFDGHDFVPLTVVNAVAWIGPAPEFLGIESTDIPAIYALLGRVPPAVLPGSVPAAATDPDAPPTDAALPLIALAVLVLLLALGIIARRRGLVLEQGGPR